MRVCVDDQLAGLPHLDCLGQRRCVELACFVINELPEMIDDAQVRALLRLPVADVRVMEAEAFLALVFDSGGWACHVAHALQEMGIPAFFEHFLQYRNLAEGGGSSGRALFWKIGWGTFQKGISFLIDDRAQHGLCGVFDAFERNLVQFERNLTMLVELRLEMRRHQR